jgi:hypothetical protein
MQKKKKKGYKHELHDTSNIGGREFTSKLTS